MFFLSQHSMKREKTHLERIEIIRKLSTKKAANRNKLTSSGPDGEKLLNIS